MIPKLDHDRWKRLHPELRRILQLELRAGNRIEDIVLDCGLEGATFVLLSFPFQTTESRPPLRFVRLGDRGVWDAHYMDVATAQIVACGFDGE